MNRITVVKNKNYTVISNVILRDARLSLKAKGLLVTILGLPDDWDFTVSGITKTLKEGRESIASGIAELMEYGYCSRTNERNEAGQYLGYDYTFYETPMSTEAPTAESPTTENPTQVNPTQLSTQNPISKQRKKETEEIFVFWKETMSLNGTTMLTSKRKQKIQSRLAEGYNIERIKNAIVGCSLSPFHNGQNDTRTKYNDIELICRSGEKVEFFEAIANTQQKPTMSDEEAQARADFLISQELNNGR